MIKFEAFRDIPVGTVFLLPEPGAEELVTDWLHRCFNNLEKCAVVTNIGQQESDSENR